MRVVDFPQWSGQSSVVTPAPSTCPAWYGLAIGPQSDEAVVSVAGIELHAGRVLPVASKSYTVGRARPLSSNAAVLAALGGVTIAFLQLVLFESQAEMMAYSAMRPAKVYSTPAGGATVAANTTSTLLSIPYVNRSECFFQLWSSSTVAVQLGVYGARYSAGFRTAQGNQDWLENQIVTQSSIGVPTSGQVTYRGTLAGSDSLAGGAGGERWDMLSFIVQTGAQAALFAMDARVAGDV